MKRGNWIYIWVLVNALLIIRYLVDPFLIVCVPCIPDAPCSPCRTDMAANIWSYLLLWNALSAVFYLVLQFSGRSNAKRRK